ncbi:MAG: Serine phosphatase RsbU, regulator of sigma subunit [Candidatus Ozemobacter sibiricus]|uniref:Serine phosphatase RsbU, regulator of sigma subunit n=1 Tax=Candidatus Ozemobacter sibiricus TaxID=2268124 RepID=A0A367ZNT1_9BACT|nr:MAG: Serine phosphatase RsbU, regulator of sigma subunit [Candidatus Ozemobacter sibiricus]
MLSLSMTEVLDNLEDLGVYITDRQRRIVFWNKAAARITGFAAAEVVGRSCHDKVLSHVDRHGRSLCDSSVCPLALAMEQGRARTPRTFVFSRAKDGARVPMAVSVTPIKDAAGVVVGGLEVFREAASEVRDLELAQTVQRQWLPGPEQLARWPFLGHACCMAEMVGGDLVRVFPGANGTVAGLLADISGHGVASALVTGFLVSNLIPLEGKVRSPVEILQHLAGLYEQGGSTFHYYSAQAFVYDPVATRLHLANAGHPPPILLEEGGAGRFLDLPSDLIGLFEAREFATLELPDFTGKRLVIYSDGMTEAPDPAGRRLGEAGLLAACQRLAGLPPANHARALVDHVFAYTHAADPVDDLTALVLDGFGLARVR